MWEILLTFLTCAEAKSTKVAHRYHNQLRLFLLVVVVNLVLNNLLIEWVTASGPATFCRCDETLLYT